MTDRPTEAQHVACQMPTDEELAAGAPDVWSAAVEAVIAHQVKQNLMQPNGGIASRIRADLATPFVTSDLSTSVPVTSDAGPVEAGPAVSVKDLEWHKSHIRSWCDDWHTIPAAYTVRCADENGWKWSNGCGSFGYASTAVGAKMEANRHHADYIRSALATAPASARSSSPDRPDADNSGAASDAAPAFSEAAQAEIARLQAALSDVIGCDHHNFSDGPPPRFVQIARAALGDTQ